MKNRSAFTVIELLVVISILAILAALLFPVFASAKSSGHSSSCIQQLRQVGVASSLYRADWEDRLPYAVSARTKFTAQATPESQRGTLFREAVKLQTIETVLLPYKVTAGVWKCAMDKVEPIFLAENTALPANLQWKPTYFETFGSSFDFDDVTAVLLTGHEQLGSSDAILFCDYAAVHGPATASMPGDRNLLFADTHAQLDTKNLWGTNFVPTTSGDWY